LTINSIGEAINIELYVQTIVPNIITKINHLIVSGQNRNIVVSTKRRVRLVYILLLSVSLTDKSIISSRFFPLFHCFQPYCLRFHLILSKITIVSLIEYPRIVKSAVIKKVSILNSGKYIEAKI
jgi:hypothetical protein